MTMTAPGAGERDEAAPQPDQAQPAQPASAGEPAVAVEQGAPPAVPNMRFDSPQNFRALESSRQAVMPNNIQTGWVVCLPDTVGRSDLYSTFVRNLGGSHLLSFFFMRDGDKFRAVDWDDSTQAWKQIQGGPELDVQAIWDASPPAPVFITGHNGFFIVDKRGIA